MNKEEVKFKQIETGAFSFRSYDENNSGYVTNFSHSLYGLDENGDIWKHNSKQNNWVKLSERTF
ncbi:MAG: hypothetical protein HOG49_31950 [Candidatus Scalindua sp.]|jgi:hypothetical protein|nr:hypothetical protein [Candidatus Scalindua sp.]